MSTASPSIGANAPVANCQRAAEQWCRLMAAPRLYQPGHPARKAASLQAAAAFTDVAVAESRTTLGFGPEHLMVNGHAVSSESAREASAWLHRLGIAQMTILGIPRPEDLDAVAQAVSECRADAATADVAARIAGAARGRIECMTVPDAAKGLSAAASEARATGWPGVLTMLASQLEAGSGSSGYGGAGNNGGSGGGAGDGGVGDAENRRSGNGDGNDNAGAGVSGGGSGDTDGGGMASCLEAVMESCMSPDAEESSGFDAAALLDTLREVEGTRADAIRFCLRGLMAKVPGERLIPLLKLDRLVSDRTARDLEALADILPVEMILETLERAASESVRPTEESFMLLGKLASLSPDGDALHQLACIAERIAACGEGDGEGHEGWRRAVHELLKSVGDGKTYTPDDYMSLLQSSAGSTAVSNPALCGMVRGAWTEPEVHRAHIMLEVMLLTPDSAMWASLFASLHDEIPGLLEDPAGLTILARAVRLIDEAGDMDSLRSASGRLRQRLGAADVREAIMAAVRAEMLSNGDAVLLMQCGGAGAMAAAILELPRCAPLAATVVDLLTQSPGLADEVSGILASHPEKAASGLALIAEQLPLGMLMRLSSTLVGAAPASAGQALTAALAYRCEHWPIELLAAALSQPGTELNELALHQARGRAEPEVANLLAKFFSGQIGGILDREAFQAAADVWAGVGKDRRPRLLSLAWYLARGRRAVVLRRAWWSLSLLLRGHGGGEAA